MSKEMKELMDRSPEFKYGIDLGIVKAYYALLNNLEKRNGLDLYGMDRPTLEEIEEIIDNDLQGTS